MNSGSVGPACYQCVSHTRGSVGPTYHLPVVCMLYVRYQLDTEATGS